MYVVSMTLCILFNAIAAKSSSIGMLIATRMLSSGAGSSITVIGAGVIADIWQVRERGRAMGLYYLGPLLGPALGPVVGGLITERWGWRAPQWFLVLYGTIILIGIILCLPETSRVSKKATACKDETSIQSQQEPLTSQLSSKANLQSSIRQCIRTTKNAHLPLRILAYLRFPAIALTVYFASITFGIIGVFSISIQQIFSNPPYHYGANVVGLMYLPY